MYNNCSVSRGQNEKHCKKQPSTLHIIKKKLMKNNNYKAIKWSMGQIACFEIWQIGELLNK